jgi:hypothetical protein
MVWLVGALCMLLIGAGLGAIGLFLNMLGYAIVGAIMVLTGIFLLVSFRSSARSRADGSPPPRR